MADGLHQMGLSEPNTAVKEQGVISLRRRLCHGLRRRMGELVAIADHERFECIARIQLMVDRLKIQLGLKSLAVPSFA